MYYFTTSYQLAHVLHHLLRVRYYIRSRNLTTQLFSTEIEKVPEKELDGQSCAIEVLLDMK